MVGRGRADLDGDLHAGAVLQLVGVDARRETAGSTGAQDLARLVAVEGAAVAEHVDPARVRRAGLEHLPDHQRDVVVRAVGVLRRHDVRAEEGDLVDEPGAASSERRSSCTVSP